MRTEIIHDIGTLERLEPAWWRLWRCVPDASAFTTPAWLIPWWRAFAPGALWTVAAWEDDRLVGLAPLYLETGALGRRLLPLGISLSDSFDVLIDAECPAAGPALMAALNHRAAEWDIWSTEELAPEARLLACAAPHGWSDCVEPQSASPILLLPGVGEGLGAVIPARKLRKWRMAQNRAARRRVSLDCVTDPAELGGALQALFRLHAERWESRGKPGVLADARVRGFHEEAAPALLSAGLLQLASLSIDGVVAGVYYGFQHGGRADAYLGGFDPSFGFESPGTLLLGAAIEAAHADGARRFGFLRGAEAYKYEWGATDAWTSRRVFRPRRPPAHSPHE